jgi:SAM-dependent methyltransferase
MNTFTCDPAWRTILDRSAFFNDSGYGSFVSGWSFDYYRQRAINVGFTGLRRVLDVGCGHGHWTCALASLNEEVVGVDIHQHRVQIADELIKDLWIDNARTVVGNAMELPFGDAEFDGLFCYGVFMFLDPLKALAEFRRVLRPGGKLYICTNGPGWWLHLAMRSVLSNRPMARAGWRALIRSKHPGTPTSYSKHGVIELLESNGFVDAHSAGEGELIMCGELSGHVVKPVYKAKFATLDYVIEAVACKAGGESSTNSTEFFRGFPLLRESQNVSSTENWSYLEFLQRFRADDSDEISNATHFPRLSWARAVGAGVDRANFLKAIVDICTEGARTETEKIRSLVTFCQRNFYHHFAVQPIEDGVLVQDPVEVLAMRTARCGSSARFLVDLLEVAGFEAGLIAGACHTTAEVFLDGAWRLLDPNLYPPGVHLLEEGGGLLETAKAVNHPELLDRPPSYINYNAVHIDAFCAAYPRIAAHIEAHLRCAIFPSIGYFGRDFAGERVGLVSRYRKLKQIDRSWTDWTQLQKVEDLRAPALPTMQRPEQVRNVALQAGMLMWSPVRTASSEDRVTYDVHVSPVSRAWSYAAIPHDCTFNVPGNRIRTTINAADISGLTKSGINYVTLIARRSDALQAFYLPSEEFIVQV